MKNLKDNVVNTFLAVSFFTLTAFFFSAMNVHYINIAEFDFTATKVAVYLIVICIILTLVITKIVSFFGHKTVEKIVVFFLALGGLVWLQANILPWDYGMLDGNEIDWDAKKIYGYLDSVMWVSGFILAFFKSKLLYKNAKTISIAFILIQTIFLVITVNSAPSEPSFKSYTILEDQKYNFSKDKNVIVIILDAFQTDVFQELINDEPSYKNVFDGFTYYRNSLSAFPTTYPAVPSIMTGQYYENKIPMQEFIKEAYLGNSLPKLLKGNGYEVDLFAIKNTVFYDESIASNFVKRNDLLINSTEFMRFMTADVFKIVPHFAKRFVYNRFTKKQTEKSVTDQFLEFVDGVKNKTTVVDFEDEVKTFKFFHLIGLHVHLTIDENFRIKEMDTNRSNVKKQGMAMLKAMKLLIENLKKLEVYDNSMIVIIGDHGFGTDINLGLYKKGLVNANKIPTYDRERAIPLILVKAFEAKGNLKISDAPVSLIDIPITIFRALGINGNFVGKSILEMKGDDSRVRRYLYFDWNHEYWKLEKRYLPPIKEYLVTEFSWLETSWHDTGKELVPPTIK